MSVDRLLPMLLGTCELKAGAPHEILRLGHVAL